MGHSLLAVPPAAGLTCGWQEPGAKPSERWKNATRQYKSGPVNTQAKQNTVRPVPGQQRTEAGLEERQAHPCLHGGSNAIPPTMLMVEVTPFLFLSSEAAESSASLRLCDVDDHRGARQAAPQVLLGGDKVSQRSLRPGAKPGLTDHLLPPVSQISHRDSPTHICAWGLAQGLPHPQGCGQAAHCTGGLAQGSEISSYEIIHVKFLQEGKIWVGGLLTWIYQRRGLTYNKKKLLDKAKAVTTS